MGNRRMFSVKVTESDAFYSLPASAQQTYNQYLEGLNDRVPELYEMALEQYTRAGNDLLTQYGLLLDRDNQDYSRWQDQASLARSQVETLLGMGMRPSDELLNQSGLSSEYISALLSRGSSRGGGGSGGNSGGRRRTSDGSQDQGIDIEKEYLAMKQAGAKSRETDNYLKSAISAGLISNKAATELRNKRY